MLVNIYIPALWREESLAALPENYYRLGLIHISTPKYFGHVKQDSDKVAKQFNTKKAWF